MKTYSTEILSKRINTLERKLQRYTEVQADLYTQVTEIAETLEKVRNTVKHIQQEIQVIKKQVRKIRFTGQNRI